MMEPHMIDFIELASLGWKLYLYRVCDWGQSCGFHHDILINLHKNSNFSSAGIHGLNNTSHQLPVNWYER